MCSALILNWKKGKKRRRRRRRRGMVGPGRPQFVLFGSSIVQLSFALDGWGSILADIYSRKVTYLLQFLNCRSILDPVSFDRTYCLHARSLSFEFQSSINSAVFYYIAFSIVDICRLTSFCVVTRDGLPGTLYRSWIESFPRYIESQITVVMLLCS